MRPSRIHARSASSSSAPRVRPGLRREPLLELRERDVEPDRAPRAGVHRHAEAGRARRPQFTPIERAPARAGVAVRGVCDQEDPVLHLDRVQVAGAQPDERVPHVGQGRRRDRDGAVGIRRARSGSSRAAGTGSACRRRGRAPTRTSRSSPVCSRRYVPGPCTSRIAARKVVDALDRDPSRSRRRGRWGRSARYPRSHEQTSSGAERRRVEVPHVGQHPRSTASSDTRLGSDRSERDPPPRDVRRPLPVVA